MFRGAILATALLICARPLTGGIALDGSFGTSGALPGPNYMIQASFGKTVGNNLFQSFNQFNLISSESATFAGPANIHNIVSRVTGGSPSSIDGQVNSDIQGANLFFINPFGVVFGQHAQISVSGSVAISTAHYLKMADGGRFNASLGGGDNLTSAPISAFGFLNSNPAAVSMANATLNAAPGQSFSVIAGDITLNGTQLSAPGGNVALFSARATGEVAYDVSAPSAHFRDSTLADFGNITIQGSKVAIDSVQGGGKIAMQGGQVLITDSTTVSSSNQGSNVGGDIELTADALSVLNGALVVAQTVSSGDGGNVSVQSTDLTIAGDNGVRNSSIRSNATSGTGNAGSLIVNTTNLSLTNGGTLNGNTTSAGRGAPITVNAENAIMSDPGTLDLASGIFESVISATGNASDVNVNITGTLTILNGGAISDTTFAAGNGGNLNVHAGSLTIDGSGVPGIFTGIATDSNLGATGNAGDLTIAVDQALNIVGGAEIISGTFSSGKGGNLNVHAGSLSIDGSAAPGLFTGISADTVSGATGDAGNLTVTVDHALNIVGGGEIAARTFTNGNGGNIDVHAGSLSIDGSGSFDTGIFASAFSSGNAGNLMITVDQAMSIVGGGTISTAAFSSGNGGSLELHVDQRLTIFGGGEITAATFSSGQAGDLSIHASSLLIDGSTAPETFTGISVASFGTGAGGNLSIVADQKLKIAGVGDISADAFSSGNGGNITIDAGVLAIVGSSVPSFAFITAVSTSIGDAGDITLHVGNFKMKKGFIGALSQFTGRAGSIELVSQSDVQLSDHSKITVSAAENGGDIKIRAPGLVSLIDSLISAAAGNTGGNITIDPIVLELRNSTISASAGSQGGKIRLLTSFLDGPVKTFTPGSISLAFNSSITATGGTSNGTVNIASPALDLGSELITLPTSLVSAENQLRERCTALLEGEFSSFISIGRGGTEPEPEELEDEF
jgi:filamentous hemagglutinin family protein